MTPTQAQIEAAAKAMFVDDYDGEDYSWNHPDRAEQKTVYMHKAEIALTAAAEVGEPIPPEKQREAHEWMDRQLKNATIERCAQVAEDAVDCRSRQEIAAKIRTMKEEG